MIIQRQSDLHHYRGFLILGIFITIAFLSCQKSDTNSGIEYWDLTKPGFEQAREFYKSGEIEKAQQSIVRYYEKKEGPWPITPAQIKKEFRNPDYVLDAAAKILDYRFTHVNETIQLKPPIDWETNPSTNQEWIWAFNRHYEWQMLSRAYVLTGEERYARFLESLASDWILKNKPPPEINENSSTWRLIDAGLRMTYNWIYSFGLIRNSPHFSWQVKWEMLKSIREHANFLKKWSTFQNHLLMESNGLASVAAYFPEFKDAETWKKVAFNRLSKEAKQQVFADGVHYECSTHYQWTCVDVFEDTRHLAKIAGEKRVYKQLTRILKRMYLFLAYAMRPDGRPPLINDGVYRDIRFLLNKAADRYNDEQLRYVATLGQKGELPKSLSLNFPYGGFSIMRTGFKPNSAFLFFDHGPLGGFHGHEDFLNFELFAYGSPLIIDPGTFTYNRFDPFRSYFLSSAAHNLVLVNGFGQARRVNKKDPVDLEHKRAVFDSQSKAFIDLASAFYQGPFGTEEEIIYKSISHRRTILFMKPIYVVVIDYITAFEPSTFTQLFHLAPGIEQMALDQGSNECFVSSDSAILQIIPVAAEHYNTPQTRYGDENPLQGWFSPDYNIVMPSPVVMYEQDNVCEAAFYTVLLPSSITKPRYLNIEKLPLTVNGKPVQSKVGIGLKITEADRTDYLIITNGLEGTKSIPHLTTQDQIAVLRFKKGKPVLEPFQWSAQSKPDNETLATTYYQSGNKKSKNLMAR